MRITVQRCFVIYGLALREFLPFLNHNRKSFPESSESCSASFLQHKKSGSTRKEEKFIISVIWAMKKGNGILERSIFEIESADKCVNFEERRDWFEEI